jgi:hypothetical protein
MQTSMAAKYGAASFQPVLDKCIGCGRIVEEESGKHCGTFMNPAAKWRLGFCNLATHSKPEIKVVTIRINPLKAAKRASAKKKK